MWTKTRLSARERERETEEYKAAREGSSLRSGWKKRGRRTPVSFRVELTRRGKTKAKQSKEKQNQKNRNKSWSTTTSSPYNSLSLVVCRKRCITRNTPPVRAEKTHSDFYFLFFFRQIAFQDCVYISGLSPHFPLHSFRSNSCYQLLFVCLFFGVGFCPWDPSPGGS